MNERFQQMMDWLESLPQLQDKSVTKPVPASSDASFRRYFRIEVQDLKQSEQSTSDNALSYIIMDAPVEHEDCRPFIKVAQELRKMGLNVPEVVAQNLTQGFLLLSDLGNVTYLSVLQQVQTGSASEEMADKLYGDALNALSNLQINGSKAAAKLPAYDEKLLYTEMNLFSDWLLNTHLDIGMTATEKYDWQQTQKLLADSALKQPKTYVHRDYHSRNLMVTGQDNPGVLDFQDAVRGALTYDAVSLLRDCYIAWPQDQVTEWQRQYFLALCEKNMVNKFEWQAFVKAMDFIGVQRHLKASGIFARLYHRDGKDGYLNDIPMTLNYIQQVGQQYPELHSLVKLVENRVLKQLNS